MQEVEQRLDGLSTLTKAEPVAELFIDILKAKFFLHHNQVEKCFNLLSEVEEKLREYRSFPKLIFAGLHEVKSHYFWIKKDFLNYNQAAMKFLAYRDPRKISKRERLELASRVVLSLLLCKESLNFGEVVQNEFFSCLKEGEEAYLWDLVQIFNRGNV